MSAYRRVFVEGHAYFITMVTYCRRPLLCEHISLFKDALKHSKQFFCYTIDAIAVLPDHVHMIIIPERVEEYPKIIRSIKTYFSKNFPNDVQKTVIQNKRREAGIWQRRYYEHTIRNDMEMQRYRDYIHYNPVKHGLSKLAYEWQYSSFQKFVLSGMYEKGWYSMDEEMEIE